MKHTSGREHTSDLKKTLSGSAPKKHFPTWSIYWGEEETPVELFQGKWAWEKTYFELSMADSQIKMQRMPLNLFHFGGKVFDKLVHGN